MDYIPKENNYVLNPRSTRKCDWVEFTSDTLKKILVGQLAEYEIERMMPCSAFFGQLVGESTTEDIMKTIDILKATRTIHNLLNRNLTPMLALPEELNDTDYLYSLESDLINLMNDIHRELEKYHNCILEEKHVVNRNEIDQHLLTIKIVLSKQYLKWIKPRFESYDSICHVTKAQPSSFYNMCYRMKFTKHKGLDCLNIDIHGRQSFLSDWDKLFEKILPKHNEYFLAIEKYIGLMFAADLIATLHLMTVNIQIDHGNMYRPTAGDLLTDFWFYCYDSSSDSNIKVNNCIECNGLYITSSATQKGHQRCMNRRRVKIARAKKFMELKECGKSDKEAARIASIKPETAYSVIKRQSEEDRSNLHDLNNIKTSSNAV